MKVILHNALGEINDILKFTNNEREKTDIRSQQQGAAHANQPHCSNAQDRWMMKTDLRQFHSR